MSIINRDDLSGKEKMAKEEEEPEEVRAKLFGELTRSKKAEKLISKIKVLTPREIYGALCKKVEGQEHAKKSLSVLLSQHLKKIKLSYKGTGIGKANALLIGPTGCGKTLIAKTLAGIAEVPYIKIDATNLVQRGYHGEMHSWEIANLLLAEAGRVQELAECGIVFIDEIDKLAKRGICDEGILAASGIQNDLISMIDGGDIYIEPDESNYSKEKFSTKNVFFIFGGAFSDMCHINLSHYELVSFGFMPEFANRMGSILMLEPLSEEIIKKLVRQCIEEYKMFFPINDDEVNVFTELIMFSIVSDRACEKMGGRCIAPAVRKFFEDKMFEEG